MKGELLVNARLATMTGESGYGTIEDAAFAWRDDTIVYAGPQSDIPAHVQNLPQSDVNGAWITPGLIDCHTHSLFAGNRSLEHELRLSGTPYEEITRQGGGILSTVRATRAASDRDLIQKLDFILGSEHLSMIDVKTGYGLDVETELRLLRAARHDYNSKTRVVVGYLGAHAVPPEFKGNSGRYIDLVVELIPKIAEEGLADYVDAFCENVAFSKQQVARVFDAAKKAGLPVRLHADQLSPMGAAGLAADYGALSADHLEFTIEADVKKMAKSGTVAVLLPLATFFLRQTQFPPVDLFRKHGVPMAVATDFNPGTAPTNDLRLAMTMACIDYGLTVEEAWRGVTVNAARALGRGHHLGQLKEGYLADFNVWTFDNPRDYLFDADGIHIAYVCIGGDSELNGYV